VTDLQWEATSGDFSPDGKWLTYEINEDGRRDIYLAAAGGSDARRIDLPPGINATAGRPRAFSPKGDKLLVAHQSSTQPADFWVVDLATGRSTQLTHSAIASLDAAVLPPSQIVHYKSFDGTIISAFLWLPFNLERNGRNPGIVYHTVGRPVRLPIRSTAWSPRLPPEATQ
jgi:dipeptidyl aminopeptidase/acylaminoacyl peptidase